MSDLLYIIGSGRSGSTVLERVLNSAPQVVGVGELHAIWRLPMDQLRCSCGDKVSVCSFWQEALDVAKIGEREISRLAELESSVVRNRHLMWLRYDLSKIRADVRLAEFATLQARLFNGLRVAGQGAIVLDSSKAGPRAWVLAAFLNPSILHVHRSAGDVLSSWRRPKFDPSLRSLMKKPSVASAAWDWIKAEQAAIALARVASVRRVDYLAFATSPQPALADAFEGSNPGLTSSIEWTDARTVRPSAEYHSVLGNPDRFDQREIVISPKTAAERSGFGWAERNAISVVGRTLDWAFP